MRGGRRHCFLQDIATSPQVPSQYALESAPHGCLNTAWLLVNVHAASRLASLPIKTKSPGIVSHRSHKLALRHNAPAAHTGPQGDGNAPGPDVLLLVQQDRRALVYVVSEELHVGEWQFREGLSVCLDRGGQG